MVTPEENTLEAANSWRYEIQHGPDGETDYAWLYRGNEMIATMKTHHAAALTAALSEQERAVESVAWALKFNGSIIATTFKPDEAAYMKSANANCDLIPLYPAPPLSRQGEDSAEVERIITDLRHAASGLSDRLQQTQAIDNAIAFLAATRSGSASATSPKGCAE